MKKIKILLLGILAFILSSCYTTYDTAQTYDEYYVHDPNIYVYINYDFYCPYCYYDMYYCFYCNTWHVRVNHWCGYHYNWYYTWYRPHYPYWYNYHGHYTSHYYSYRDHSRSYIRDINGYRSYDKIEGKPPIKGNNNYNKYPIYKDNKIHSKPPVKNNDSHYSKPPVKQNNPPPKRTEQKIDGRKK